ncbi:unnamed protein product, partial [Rotaria sp. Silwood1]
AQEVEKSAIEEKRIHDELERQMNLFHKEKRDLFNEVNKSEKRITNTNWIKKKNFKIKLMKFVKTVKQDRVTIYGRYTLAILKEIEKQAYRFKQIPIEPVGKHTCLIDIKWAIAVEQGLGNLLTGYLSSSREDERVLLEILS